MHQSSNSENAWATDDLYDKICCGEFDEHVRGKICDNRSSENSSMQPNEIRIMCGHDFENLVDMRQFQKGTTTPPHMAFKIECPVPVSVQGVNQVFIGSVAKESPDLDICADRPKTQKNCDTVILYAIHKSRLIKEMREDFANNAKATNALMCLQRCLSTTGPSQRLRRVCLLVLLMASIQRHTSSRGEPLRKVYHWSDGLQEMLRTIRSGKELKCEKLKEARNAQYDLLTASSVIEDPTIEESNDKRSKMEEPVREIDDNTNPPCKGNSQPVDTRANAPPTDSDPTHDTRVPTRMEGNNDDIFWEDVVDLPQDVDALDFGDAPHFRTDETGLYRFDTTDLNLQKSQDP
ncbi:hypothetical protein PSENEW3_00002398 [Picochlorum sp. SENEW3]|nr:hypothetical protein PSENEW3_00002398 [Picochlorum sp. SENEW3]